MPLAGPDLWTQTFGFRPLVPVEGRPLLQVALEQRAWRDRLESRDYIFVLRDVEGLDQLEQALRAMWPDCRIVRLSHLTGGALYSALGAMSLVAPDEPVIVDLADILFTEGPEDPEHLFKARDWGAIVPVFQSTEPCYSYLEIEDGSVLRAREKQVISDHASAGVYMFANPQIYLTAAVHSLQQRDELSYRNLLFICPMVNGVIAAGKQVLAPAIRAVQPVGKLFHL
ncbi:hypothetical protein [Rhizobium sp. FKY42]|uniref:hypothetical protein n=1 Tax=Rhizobium sp. FKY42 TaxID=2562310 RepID=UPI0010C0E04C|nr:hypothetical protein [Rhizobium sp. FKY42]